MTRTLGTTHGRWDGRAVRGRVGGFRRIGDLELPRRVRDPRKRDCTLAGTMSTLCLQHSTSPYQRNGVARSLCRGAGGRTRQSAHPAHRARRRPSCSRVCEEGPVRPFCADASSPAGRALTAEPHKTRMRRVAGTYQLRRVRVLLQRYGHRRSRACVSTKGTVSAPCSQGSRSRR